MVIVRFSWGSHEGDQVRCMFWFVFFFFFFQAEDGIRDSDM